MKKYIYIITKSTIQFHTQLFQFGPHPNSELAINIVAKSKNPIKMKKKQVGIHNYK